MLIKIIKKILKPLTLFFRKRYLRLKITRRALSEKNSPYIYSRHDIKLYCEETYVQLFHPKVINSGDSDFLLIEIQGVQIYWPQSLPHKDLPWLYHEIFDPFKKNPSSYDHPALDIQKKSWIIDGGAGEGYFSKFAMKQSDVKMLIAVEPLRMARNALYKSLPSTSSLTVEILQSALGESVGSAYLRKDNEHICDSKIESCDGQSDDNLELVAISTLDQIAADWNIKGEGLIKMDIEGAEMSALKGGKKLMEKYKPALAVAVYHDYLGAIECAQIIKSANPDYIIEFRGCFGYFDPLRPYMLFAY